MTSAKGSMPFVTSVQPLSFKDTPDIQAGGTTPGRD